MPPISKIIKCGLESRTRELYKAHVPYQQIADTLSDESGYNITKAMVFQYLKNDSNFTAELVETKKKLGVKVAEAEISTIEGRLSVIDKLVQVFEVTDSKQDMCMISREIREHYDSLDKRIGKLTNNPQVTINNIHALNTLSDEQLIEIINSE
ncbi:MAG: hypothetical protein PHQ11_17530 [Paludibacter sp.]|nr:hypothetical protein [Paludibacter sp.]